MFAAAWALTWELWWPQRRLVAASLAYVSLLAVLVRAFPSDPAFQSIGAVSAVLIIFYELAIFAHGLNYAAFEGTQSCFPSRLLALPVRTDLLVACPLVGGTAAVAITWVALAQFILRPSGVEVAVVLPALTFAVLLAWVQAVAWSPLPLPWLRLIVAVLLVIAQSAAIGTGVIQQANTAALAGGAAILLAAAYAVARNGVSRARRGEGETDRRLKALLQALTIWLPIRRRHPFASAAQAQVWLESRRHAVIVPLFVGLYAALWLVGWPLIEKGADNFVRSGMFPAYSTLVEVVGFPTLFVVALLLLPPLCAITATDLGKTEGKSFAMSSFLATRPITSGALVLAKHRAALRSAFLAWAILFAEIAVWALVTGKFVEVVRGLNQFLPPGPPAKTGAVLIFLFVLFFWTWKQQTANLFMVLSGRAWLVVGGMLGGVALFVGACIFGGWVYQHAQYHDLFWSLAPWLLGIGVGLKALASCWVMRGLLLRGILATRTAVLILAIWFVVAAGLVVGLLWLIPERTVTAYILALVVVLNVPLARPAAAPLALAWNRHR